MSNLRWFFIAFACLAGFIATYAWAQTIGPPTIVAGAYKATRITTDATTVIKSGSGLLHTICFNTQAATETTTVFDNTAASGTTLALITSTTSTQGCFAYDIAFLTGLTIVTAVAAGDITVTYQ